MDTIAIILRTTIQQLDFISDTARLEAEILLAHLLKITRAQLLVRGEQTLSAEQQVIFQQLLSRRLAGEPIAYIIGQREFWSLPFAVTSDTLIPRPETELLVELALQKFPEQENIRVADLGTGSGAIALALAHERPRWQITATDNSTAALAIAKRNAVELRINNVQFNSGDWCQALAMQQFHLIISNPPYIKVGDPHLTQGNVRFEPDSALVSGDDGLQDLRQIIAEAPAHLLAGGWLLLEHGYEQAAAVRVLLLAQGYQEVISVRDLAGQERVTVGSVR
jgi:release factor glutamine methyltransferase